MLLSICAGNEPSSAKLNAGEGSVDFANGAAGALYIGEFCAVARDEKIEQPRARQSTSVCFVMPLPSRVR
jgi:hypothetical protein